MRTISDELLASQKLADRTPYLKLIATDGTTTYTFDTHGDGGAEKRLLAVDHYEEPLGGTATIKLSNYDQYFAAKNLMGWNATLGFGFLTDWTVPTGASGWSQATDAIDKSTTTYARTIIVATLLLTHAGVSASKVRIYASDGAGTTNPSLTVDIYYSDAWHTIHNGSLTKNTWVEIATGTTQLITQARVIANSVNVEVRVNEFQFYTPVSGYAEVSNVAPLFVISQRDESAGGVLVASLFCLDLWWKMAATMVVRAGNRLTGTIQNGNLFAMGETITGSVSAATGKLVGISYGSIIVTSVTGTFQVGENATGASASCAALTAVDAVSGAGGADYGKTTTVLNILKAIMPASITDVILDSDDPDAIINTYKPLLITGVGEGARSIYRQLIQMSKCVGRIQNDGKLHIRYPNPIDAVDYTYQTAHAFWYQLRERAVILPNAVLMVNRLPDVLMADDYFSGTASDATSVGLLGSFSTIESNSSIVTNAEATIFANAWIAQRVIEAYQGAVRAPMSVSQELYDKVSIIDSRSGVTVTGRVGRIDHRYSPGVYEIEVRLGGVVSELNTAYLGPDTLSMNIQDMTANTKPSKANPYDTQIPVGSQAYLADIDFTSTAYNAISWEAGNIKLADGRIQAILAGTLTLTATHYLYAIWGNTTLQSSTVYTDAIGSDRMLVSVSSIASTSAQKAYILNPHSDSILINTDKVMDGLVTSLKLASEAVTEAKIATDAVTQGKIKALSIVAGHIQALQIDAGHIQTDAIVADKIKAGAVEAIKISVATLDAISANVGTLTSGTINGVTIYAGAGAVTLDSLGILVKGQQLEFRTAAGAIRGYVLGGATYFTILGFTTTPILLTTSGDIELAAGGEIILTNTTRPSSNGSINLGSTSYYWNYIYANTIQLGAANVLVYGSTGHIVLEAPASKYIYFNPAGLYVIPWADNTYYLGASNIRWLYGYFVNVGDSSAGGRVTNGYFTNLYRTNEYALEHIDDLALIKAMKPDRQNPNLIDRATIPSVLFSEGYVGVASTEGKPSDTILPMREVSSAEPMIDTGKEIALVMGAIRQLASRLDALEVL